MVLSPACSCGDEDPAYRESATGAGGAGGAGGNEVTAHASGGSGAGGEGGSPGDHGARGVAVGDVVSAGQVVKSPRYRMVFTLGQPTQNQGKTTSPSFRMQGGLVGANGSLP
ncbi:hypothetical protein [Sorangium sp. So ce131]|uniref:hypothetical protein n=1 Tax=Sorangium sp. So ce131 TaxID=3133282 RepID=UPI003F5F4BF7